MFPSKVLSKLDLITYNFEPGAEYLISFIFLTDTPCQKWKYPYPTYLLKQIYPALGNLSSQDKIHKKIPRLPKVSQNNSNKLELSSTSEGNSMVRIC